MCVVWVCSSSNIAHWNAIEIATNRLDFENGGDFQLVEINQISITQRMRFACAFLALVRIRIEDFPCTTRKCFVKDFISASFYVCPVNILAWLATSVWMLPIWKCESKSIWINANCLQKHTHSIWWSTIISTIMRYKSR